MVVTDAHSEWPEVQLMTSTTAAKTIQVLSRVFSCYGLPKVLVSDGPKFTSYEFETFVKSNRMKHICTAPFYPSTNGLAECFLQPFKHSLKRSTGTASIQRRLDAFLLIYCNTPHSTTKESPSMFFMYHTLRSQLDLLKPNVTSDVEKAQAAQRAYQGIHAKARSFKVRDRVLVRDYGRGVKWTPGVVSAETGPMSYTVSVRASEHWRRHIDQMLTRHAELDATTDSTGTASYHMLSDLPLLEKTAPEAATPPVPVSVSSPQVTSEENITPSQETGKRYPSRVVKPPVRYVP